MDQAGGELTKVAVVSTTFGIGFDSILVRVHPNVWIALFQRRCRWYDTKRESEGRATLAVSSHGHVWRSAPCRLGLVWMPHEHSVPELAATLCHWNWPRGSAAVPSGVLFCTPEFYPLMFSQAPRPGTPTDVHHAMPTFRMPEQAHARKPYVRAAPPIEGITWPRQRACLIL